MDTVMRVGRGRLRWLLLALLGGAAPASPQSLVVDHFARANGLVTNEFASLHPNDPAAVVSPVWEISSGSLFVKDGAAWTGLPDDAAPDAASATGNDSAVFRLTTKRDDLESVSVSFLLLMHGLTSTPSTPPADWDGLQVWLRYQDDDTLYCAGVNRRDNTVVIKKKAPGGSPGASVVRPTLLYIWRFWP